MPSRYTPKRRKESPDPCTKRCRVEQSSHWEAERPYSPPRLNIFAESGWIQQEEGYWAPKSTHSTRREADLQASIQQLLVA
ncbi:hypothetical protein Y032_0311g2143 [Ancylostoma ceylanicum]|uniref:Uncharacterized protein n=1 Tax=Ancylostoma ceylanicum TaxID=53326 RepID=A0A016S308_9BILA|nr:hypothetical protein Y032_0311g2143 [Ancylostoma ceylanicum]